MVRLKTPGCSQVATRPLDSRRWGLLFTEETMSQDPFVPEPSLSTLNTWTALQTACFLPWKHRSTLPAASGKGGPHGSCMGLRLGSGSPCSGDPTGELTLEPWKEVRFKWRNWGSDLWTAWARLLEDGGSARFLNALYHDRFKKRAPLCFRNEPSDSTSHFLPLETAWAPTLPFRSSLAFRSTLGSERPLLCVSTSSSHCGSVAPAHSPLGDLNKCRCGEALVAQGKLRRWRKGFYHDCGFGYTFWKPLNYAPNWSFYCTLIITQ